MYLLFAPDNKISFHGIGVFSVSIVLRLNLIDPAKGQMRTLFNRFSISAIQPSKSFSLFQNYSLESKGLGVEIESCPVTLPHM